MSKTFCLIITIILLIPSVSACRFLLYREALLISTPNLDPECNNKHFIDGFCRDISEDSRSLYKFSNLTYQRTIEKLYQDPDRNFIPIIYISSGSVQIVIRNYTETIPLKQMNRTHIDLIIDQLNIMKNRGMINISENDIKSIESMRGNVYMTYPEWKIFSLKSGKTQLTPVNAMNFCNLGDIKTPQIILFGRILI